MTEQENHIEKILTHPIETDEDYQALGELVEDESAEAYMRTLKQAVDCPPLPGRITIDTISKDD